MSSLPANRDGASNPQRKILEDLQLKKQMFLKQGVSQSLTAHPPTHHPTGGWQSGTDGGVSTSNPRSCLASANAQSYGYFIAQESSFGNTILPVLPRLDPAQPPKPAPRE